MSSREIVNRVKEALKKVIDPELGVDIVSAGFIKDIRVVGDGIVEIDLMLTSPFCPLSDWLVFQTKRAAETVNGVKEARVKVVGFGIPEMLKKIFKLT